MRATLPLGVAAQQASAEPGFGFHADINRRLLGPAPPRCIDPMTTVQALEEAKALLESLTALLQLAKQRSLREQCDFFCRYSDRAGQPNVVCSSVLMELFFSSDTQLVLGHSSFEDMVVRAHAMPRPCPPAANYTITQLHNYTITQ
jgi:hypothetical protein